MRYDENGNSVSKKEKYIYAYSYCMHTYACNSVIFESTENHVHYTILSGDNSGGSDSSDSSGSE